MDGLRARGRASRPSTHGRARGPVPGTNLAAAGRAPGRAPCGGGLGLGSGSARPRARPRLAAPRLALTAAQVSRSASFAPRLQSGPAPKPPERREGRPVPPTTSPRPAGDRDRAGRGRGRRRGGTPGRRPRPAGACRGAWPVVVTVRSCEYRVRIEGMSRESLPLGPCGPETG